MPGCNLHGARLQSVHFEGSTLFDVDLTNASLQSCAFNQAHLTGNLGGANFMSCSFEGTHFYGVKFSTGPEFVRSDWRKADFGASSPGSPSKLRALLYQKVVTALAPMLEHLYTPEARKTFERERERIRALEHQGKYSKEEASKLLEESERNEKMIVEVSNGQLEAAEMLRNVFGCAVNPLSWLEGAHPSVIAFATQLRS